MYILLILFLQGTLGQNPVISTSKLSSELNKQPSRSYDDKVLLLIDKSFRVLYIFKCLSLFSSYDPELTTNELKSILLLNSPPGIVLKLPSRFRCLVDPTDTHMFHFSETTSNIVPNDYCSV